MVRLKVARSKWNHLALTTHSPDPKQSYITTYFDECSKDQRTINLLIEHNAELRDEIRRNKAEALLEPNFLHELVQHNMKNINKKRPSYNDHLKDIALYIFVLTGPKAYSTLSLNLRGSLPSLATVRRKLGQEQSISEAEFQFDHIKEQMLLKEETLTVAIAEDDTKITPRLRYDYINDEIVGLQLPLSGNGVPVRHSFKFTTLSEVKKYIEKNRLSSYAKLMTVRSIMPRSTTYHLVIYGTQGSDKFCDVKLRWEFVKTEFAKRGIECLTFSSDGAPAFMRTMQVIADIPKFSYCESILFRMTNLKMYLFFFHFQPKLVLNYSDGSSGVNGRLYS